MTRRTAGLWDFPLLDIAKLALRRSGAEIGKDPRKDRGFWWACYCDVCCKLRVAATEGSF